VEDSTGAVGGVNEADSRTISSLEDIYVTWS
jgi:hypothetical protein